MSSGKFDWSIELTVNGGGLKEVPIGFYETVPTTGYSNEIKLQFRKDDANYKNFFSNIYFFSLREGKLHGVMNIMIYPMDMFDDFAIFNGKPRILLDSKINKINNKIYWEQYE